MLINVCQFYKHWQFHYQISQLRSVVKLWSLQHFPYPKPNRLAVLYFTLFCCRWRVWRKARGNSTPGSNPCPGPLRAGVPLVSSSPALSPWFGAGNCSTLYPRLNYLWRWFKRLFHLVPRVLSLFCFLLSCGEERDFGRKSGYFWGGQGLLGWNPL